MRPLLVLPIIASLLLSLYSCAESVDPYFDDVADLQEGLVEDTDVLLADALRELEQCERSLFSVAACDRAMDLFGDWGDLISGARSSVRTFDPPPKARAWHDDYLAYLADAADWVDTIVFAYSVGDIDTFEGEFEEFDSFIEREDELSEDFVAIQRAMGAE